VKSKIFADLTLLLISLLAGILIAEAALPQP